ncbi:Hypothetical protein, putative [Bodo saltans]|uniref:Pyrrolo-quinoline quinone repeat domain-containing protein n=1 Tax=Bodo saltans TaxID=75058 RepID=A0A0S4IZR1_BODSA|nr:Hypothetical protein, putative [Bodo saltans]|eukprot:CUG32406.1 Hypothetical protein, putative [Bodo saltans]
MNNCAPLFLLAISVATAIKVDPIVWSTPLDNNILAYDDTQWIATKSFGAVIVSNNNNLTSLDPRTGAVLWSNTHKDINVTNEAVFDISTTTVALGVGNRVFGFNLVDGAYIGSVKVTGPNNIYDGISSLQEHRGVFIVWGQSTLAVIGSDLTVHYSIPEPNATTEVIVVGVHEDYVYFVYQVDSDPQQSILKIVNLNTFAETIVYNVSDVSSTGMNGRIVFVGPALVEYPPVGYLELSSGAILWQVDVEHYFIDYGTFLTSDLVVLNDGYCAFYALDAKTGALVFKYTSTLTTIQSAGISAGRLVLLGSIHFPGPWYVEAIDLTTGTSLGMVFVPVSNTPGTTSQSPTSIAVGTNYIALNNQGYTCIDLLTITAVSHQLSLPGVQNVGATLITANSTTFVFAGQLNAAAVVISN